MILEIVIRFRFFFEDGAELKIPPEILPPFKERQRSIKIEGQQIAPPDDHQKRRLFAQASINHSEFSRSLDDSENLFMLPYYLKVRPNIEFPSFPISSNSITTSKDTSECHVHTFLVCGIGN